MVDSWFMMSSPFPILTVVVLYLLFIRIGPRIMKNRPPLGINKLISYYNAAQVVLATMICIKVGRIKRIRANANEFYHTFVNLKNQLPC